MASSHRKFREDLLLAGATLVITLASGCISGSLASSTGPRPPEKYWSVARRQMAHVGEEVHLDFFLQDWQGRFLPPQGLADYCAVIVGYKRIEVTPDIHGRFRFSHRFTRVRPGDRVELRMTAFRQRGGRDWMQIRGEWFQSDSPYEEADRKIATDSIKFTLYQVPIDLLIVRPPDDFDIETGVLRIRRFDGSTSAVYIDRPGRPGFTITGPEPDGYYRVHYQPDGIELNPVGTTDVEFTIYDRAGQPHHAPLTIDTP